MPAGAVNKNRDPALDIFPVFFGTDARTVILFGGGELALRKFRLLAKTHARIVIAAPELCEELQALADARTVCVPLSQAVGELKSAAFAIIALEDRAGAEAAARLCRTYKIPVNVVDRPELCDFTVPSILDRGSVVAAVATGGAAPVLARDIRARLEEVLPERIGELASFARGWRARVKAGIHTEPERRAFWEHVLRGPVAELVLSGEMDRAEAAMQSLLDGRDAPIGVVHLVGAGPGDPELLTLKALCVIQDADIVFHDRLVGDGIMELVRRDAVRVAVGKSKGDHSVPQEKIHDLLIASARKGQRVVRLKGGDPFVFGRGGEELEVLQDAGVDVHVIPGISSALGCAAGAGIALTHRDHAQSVTFVTGHARLGDVPDLDWSALSGSNQTVVVFMGVGTAEAISDRLIRAGRGPATPVAVIENGTRKNELRVFGRLDELGSLIGDNGIEGPALLIIGETVARAASRNAAVREPGSRTAGTVG